MFRRRTCFPGDFHRARSFVPHRASGFPTRQGYLTATGPEVLSSEGRFSRSCHRRACFRGSIPEVLPRSRPQGPVFKVPVHGVPFPKSGSRLPVPDVPFVVVISSPFLLVGCTDPSKPAVDGRHSQLAGLNLDLWNSVLGSYRRLCLSPLLSSSDHVCVHLERLGLYTSLSFSSLSEKAIFYII